MKYFKKIILMIFMNNFFILNILAQNNNDYMMVKVPVILTNNSSLPVTIIFYDNNNQQINPSVITIEAGSSTPLFKNAKKAMVTYFSQSFIMPISINKISTNQTNTASVLKIFPNNFFTPYLLFNDSNIHTPTGYLTFYDEKDKPLNSPIILNGGSVDANENSKAFIFIPVGAVTIKIKAGKNPSFADDQIKWNDQVLKLIPNHSNSIFFDNASTWFIQSLTQSRAESKFKP